MARKFLTDIDLAQNHLINALLEVIAGNATSPADGRIWYDSTNHTVKTQINGSVVDLLARSTHTGQQTASTISDFATAVEAIRLDQMSTPTADVAWGSHKITGLANPTNAQDASTKNYVDTALSTATAGLSYKAPVRFATTANDGLTGLTARDGVTPSAGDRVLVKNQTTAADNGIYLAASGSWTRALDADSAGELPGGTIVPVDQGTTNADTMWMLAANVVTVGTTAQTWAPFGAGSTYTAGNGISIASGIISAVTAAASGLVNPVGAGGLAVDYTQVAKKYVNTFTGNGTTTTFAVTHNLNNSAPVWSVYNGTQEYDLEFQPSGVNAGSFVAVTAPPSGTYNYTMLG